MTLNLNKSRILCGLLGDEKCFFAAPFVDTTTYNSFVDNEYPTWVEAFNQDNLFATAEGGGTYQVEGIDTMPLPPKK